MKNYYKSQKGLTLVELMVALTLSLFLLLGLTQVYTANQASYRMTEAHARLQENARFALDILTRDIRSAGYTGCRTIENMNVITVAESPVPPIMDSDTIITGSEGKTGNSWVPALATEFSSTSIGVLEGTDTIMIQRASSCGGNLTGNVSSANANVQIFSPNTCNLAQGDVVMISDCEDAHIFRISSNPTSGSNTQTLAHGNNGNKGTHFCTSYSSFPQSGSCDAGTDKIYTYDAEIFRFRAFTYFISDDSNGEPALWRLDHNATTGTASNPVELIEGIENMQITYGIDSNDDDIVESYIGAEAVETASQWDKVISARISLLARTLDDNLTIDDQIVTYNGSSITGRDGKLRRVFTTTIGVRNRVQ